MNAAGDGTAQPDTRRIRQLRTRIWRQTLARVRISEVTEACPLGLCREPTTTCIGHPGPARTAGSPPVTVASEDCLERARRIVTQGTRVAVLSMASAGFPGGGVQRGAGAQEENLHRPSDACRYLYDQRERLYPIETGTCLLSKDVTVFRGPV